MGPEGLPREPGQDLPEEAEVHCQLVGLVVGREALVVQNRLVREPAWDLVLLVAGALEALHQEKVVLEARVSGPDD